MPGLIGGGYAAIRVHDGPLASDTFNVNSTSYVAIGALAFNIDLDEFHWTEFRIVMGGNSNAGGATVTLQLATFAAPATPIHSGGDDLVVANAAALYDSGWKSRDQDLAGTGLKEYIVACKGSNSTVDLTAAYLEVHLRRR